MLRPSSISAVESNRRRWWLIVRTGSCERRHDRAALQDEQGGAARRAQKIYIATVNDLDMIISMNFQHIVKRKTKIGTEKINALNGYRAVEICSPMEVVENEND